MQNLLDKSLALIAIVILSPVLICCILVLRFTGEKEIFYKQERVGLDNKSFFLLKFATMLKNSPSIGSGTITLKDDPRVLPFGKFLRKTKINELPQLLNILNGIQNLILSKGLEKQLNLMNKEDQVLVSIIMNCHNGEKYLKESIDSVIDQTYSNWELIFFNNLFPYASSRFG